MIKYIHIIEDRFMKCMHVANGEKNLVSPLLEIRNILILLEIRNILIQIKGSFRGLTFPCLVDHR